MSCTNLPTCGSFHDEIQWLGRFSRIFAIIVLICPVCLAGDSNGVYVDKLATKPGKFRLKENPWPQSGIVSWLSGMDPLPESHSPNSSHWVNSIAVCAIMKDENITDVVEWITYHHWLGVDHIFLTDNNSTDGSAQRQELAAAFPESFLTIHNEFEPRGQLKVYAWCAEEHRSSFNWMAFLDIDEFIVLRGSEKRLKPFLNEYKQFPGLSLHWIIVGPSDQEYRPASGGVLPYYDQCHVQPHPTVKTIANMYFITGITTHPHNFEFQDGAVSVNEDKEPIPKAWHARPEAQDVGVTHSDCFHSHDEVMCFVTDAPRARPLVAEKGAVFHYVTRSVEDYNLKLLRGAGVPAFSRNEEWFQTIEQDQEKAEICSEPVKLAQECCADVYSNLWRAKHKDRTGFRSLGSHVSSTSRYRSRSSSSSAKITPKVARNRLRSRLSSKSRS